MNQYTFGTLWDFAKEIQAGEMTIKEGTDCCKKLAAEKKRELVKEGRKARRSTMRGQMREWWSLGNYCGLSCTVFVVNVF